MTDSYCWRCVECGERFALDDLVRFSDRCPHCGAIGNRLTLIEARGRSEEQMTMRLIQDVCDAVIARAFSAAYDEAVALAKEVGIPESEVTPDADHKDEIVNLVVETIKQHPPKPDDNLAIWTVATSKLLLDVVNRNRELFFSDCSSVSGR